VGAPEQSLESLTDFNQALTHFELCTNQKGREILMYFTDDSLLPENQAPLMITAAPLWADVDVDTSTLASGRRRLRT
jgi:hypothetical protein